MTQTPGPRMARSPMIKFVLLGLVLVSMTISSGANAQTLRQAVEGAWALDPQIKAFEARRNEFIARREAAGALFPAPPAITLSHATDQLIQNKRQRVTEGELSTPLWLPGEGTATERVAQADLVRTDAQLALARLTVAGAVRDAVYKYALAKREAEIADRRVENARALESDVGRRVRAGDVAALEHDLAESELLAARATAREQQALLAAARTTLLSLTGLQTPPSYDQEPLAPTTDIARHPRLQAAERSIDAAQATLRLAGIATRDSPEIGVFLGRNRDVRGDEYDATVGLRLRIPFATEARNAPRRAAALAEVTAAQAEYAAAEREIRVELSNAQQALAATEAQTSLLEGRVRAVQSTLARLQRSYNAGEIGLLEVLRARVSLFEAEIARARNRLDIGAARARVNQALGIVP